MTAPAIMIGASGVAGLIALILSFVSRGALPRRLALASLWLALAAVPTSVAWDLLATQGPTDPAKADRLAETIAHAKNYGALVMPFAGMAMVAMRRASVASMRQRRS